jgi:alpha-glucosidase (family GH31 glycosyl hydrolase)
MEKFREKGIPFSTAVIDMDWHLTEIPEKYGSGWTGYTWNPEFFPDPKRFMDKLHEMGMRVTLNVHPADGVRAHEEAYLEMAKELGIDYENEDKIPFDASSRTFLEAYFKHLHHPNEEQGVDFWWLDWQQGSRGGAAGIDTLWLLNHLHFLDSGRNGKLPLTFSRYAGIGSHRYPVGFSGDTYTTWESLDFQPYFTANASNAGYSWWSHDIGGHQGGRRDDELTVRWVQFGVFSPIMRLHSTSNEFYGKEPWNFNMHAEKIMTEFLRLRHKLIPYLYSMNYQTHLHGLPLMQPMYYRHDVEDAYNVPNEYYFGTEMIVCPITKPVNSDTLLGKFEAWIPQGVWYDFFTGQLYRGNRRMDLYRNLDTIPVLVKAGGIIPLAKKVQDCHNRNPQELEVHVFHGTDGSFDLYEDRDGEAPVITRFRFTSGKDSILSICKEGETQGVIPENRRYEIRFRGIGNPRSIHLAGAEEAPVWSFDPETRELRVCFADNGSDMTLELSLETELPVCPDRKPYIYQLLHRAQIEYSTKVNIYEEVCRKQDTTRLLGKLYQMRLEPDLLGAIMEQVISEY